MTEDERTAVEVERITERALQNWRNESSPRSVVALFYCQVCGNDIPEARRQAVPGVSLCVECKQAEELEARLNRGL